MATLPPIKSWGKGGMKVRKSILGFIVCGLILQMVIAGAVVAATVVKTATTGALSETDWTKLLSVQQFDPSLGVLQSVEIKLTGHFVGDLAFENKNVNPATVTMTLSALINLERPDTSVIVGVNPTLTSTDAVEAFDGNFDWGGASGRTHADLSQDGTATITTTAAADLALFTGIGSISLPVTAAATAAATGPGNLYTWFTSTAGADAVVTYTYVPEPSSLAALAMSCFGLVGAAIRRRR